MCAGRVPPTRPHLHLGRLSSKWLDRLSVSKSWRPKSQPSGKVSRALSDLLSPKKMRRGRSNWTVTQGCVIHSLSVDTGLSTFSRSSLRGKVDETTMACGQMYISYNAQVPYE